ncbi:MAG: hypothetical protein A3C93_00360 [Candidatus Lloydbacteria bacterium RIFCSPHIGHO2_02_FULL_54_17]|uniref:LamG-like jellyroll fold domain-containing protein n=1 Tax=Candidatus Lloydbacteria bacterium RIFCSPHIGHO2_02_FULL_54_17 TaxID=1798664 RepID=A0A1G2DFW0_9BACT|nr:MAG: hypothetical protein A2762_01940 [Candidatus Lloydbacteria bacterium RIFCSPHIGHO2_01_FULL_54_11]OGZ11841.1 MAG: hypothetical protein A3C93_00360 [Candidatus Lloydbacteria bacterium RIFCSPHIGHO2_02_FULL_54_17]OGZ16685.1 MAG: hypothetical protein A3H76_00065 [Candidatus Lloydbacteria bacterium RIFCSPLOWO2_02_FULL_54_12]
MKNPLLLSVYVGAFMFFAAGTAFAATDDYAHYFGFDEGTGRTVGDAKGGQNGVFTGTSTGFGWASGMVGTALGMDGKDGESIVLPDAFLSGSQGSIVVWFKLNSLSNGNIIFSGRSTTDNYIHAALMVDFEGRPQFAFRTTTGGVDRKAQGSRILNKNEWYQIVFTADGQSYHMFVNGEEVTVGGDNIGKWFPDLTNHTLSYRIGSLSSNIVNGVFDGYLDDLRIYGRALTSSDVAALYNNGSPGTPGLPVAAQPAPPVVTVEVTLPSAATTTATVVTSSVVPSTVSAEGATVTVAPQATVATDLVAQRKALIDELIKQILVLIGELQKQLAALKAQGA